jgi:hypothetical protein
MIARSGPRTQVDLNVEANIGASTWLRASRRSASGETGSATQSHRGQRSDATVAEDATREIARGTSGHPLSSHPLLPPTGRRHHRDFARGRLGADSHIVIPGCT